MSKKGHPTTAERFQKRWANFKKFLEDRGSEVLEPTNPYELARFTTPEGVGVVYTNSARQIVRSHWQNGSWEAWEAFQSTLVWRVSDPVGRMNSTRRGELVERLIKRDGASCFYCEALESDQVQLTHDHVCPRAAGGPNHISNAVLACEACNTFLAAKPAKEKFDYAIERRRLNAARNVQVATLADAVKNAGAALLDDPVHI